jgi:hypothetical protein
MATVVLMTPCVAANREFRRAKNGGSLGTKPLRRSPVTC